MSKRSVVLVIAAAGALALVLWLGTRTGERRARSDEGTRPRASAPSADSERGPSAVVEPARVLPAEPASPAEPNRVQVEQAELADDRWVEGRVIFPPDTPPDESVCVVARGRKLASGREHRCKVGPDGAFRVAFAKKTRKGSVTLEARYLYLEDGPLSVDLDELSTPLVLEPELGGWIEGRIVVPADSSVSAESLAGTRVRLVDRARFRETMGQSTDAPLEGQRFTLTGLRPSSRYDLELASEIVFARRIMGLEVRPGKRTDAELVVQQGVSVSGRVVDEHGAPLDAISVNAYSRDPSTHVPSSFLGRYPIQTREDGAFHFRGLAPGHISLEADGPGMQDAKLELEATEPGLVLEGIELVLAQRLSLTGRVQWPDGRPAKASIEVHGAGHTEGPERFWTGTDGVFAAEGLTEGTYRLEARATETIETVVEGKKAKEHRKWHAQAEGVPAGTAGILLTLEPALSVFGTVRDDLGALVDSFRIEAREANPRTFHFREPPRLVESFRDARGAFELPGFVPGAWNVEAHAQGHGASQPVPVEISNASASVELVVPRVGHVEGIVVGPDGRRVGRAEVSLQREQPAFIPWGLDEGRIERADENGRFIFEDVAPGSIYLRVTSEAAATSEPMAFTLEPGALLADIELRLGH